MLAVQKRLPPTVEDVRRRITQIDHWGNNSNLLADYDAYLKALSESYPAARIESLDGHPAAQDTIRGDLDEVATADQGWLAEAAQSQSKDD